MLRRCLENDPKRRTHDIADVRLDLDEKDVAMAATPLPSNPRAVNVERVTWALLVATLAGVVAYGGLRESPAPEVVRFQIEPPEGARGTPWDSETQPVSAASRSAHLLHARPFRVGDRRDTTAACRRPSHAHRSRAPSAAEISR